MRPPRGNYRNERGGRGAGPSPRGRGFSRGRGTGSPQARGRGFGRPQYRNLEDIDFEIQIFQDAPSSNRGSPFLRGRGRGGNLSGPHSRDERRGYGRGGDRGRRPGWIHNERTPLAKLLDFDRPFLKPIKFVPAQYTPILFQEKEEIFKVPETVSDESHVPTAEKVNKIFSHQQTNEETPEGIDDSGDLETEGLTTVDFDSLADFVASALSVEDDQREGPKNVITSEPETSVSITAEAAKELIEEKQSASVDVATESIFVIDTSPQDLSEKRDEIVVGDRVQDEPLGGSLQEDEDIIVYSPPYRQEVKGTEGVRTGTKESELTKNLDEGNDANVASSSASAHVSEPSSFESFSLSLEALSSAAARNRQFKQIAASPRTRLTKRARYLARQKMQRRGTFASFGALMEETHLQDEVRERDPRHNERRQGDSDLDWGESIDEISSGLGGMDLDEDVDPKAYEAFIKGMANANHVTMDDIADDEKLRQEDDEDEDISSLESSEDDSEMDRVVTNEESQLIGDEAAPDTNESEGDMDESDDDEDLDETPTKAFKRKLERVRESSKGKGKARDTSSDEDGSDEDEDDDFNRDFTWADEDDDFIAMLDDYLGRGMIKGDRNRMRRKAIISGALDGDDDDDLEEFEPAKPALRGKKKIIPEELKEQWEKDRAKKAERRRQRDLERLEAAGNPFVPHKTGKKSRKAMLRALEEDQRTPKERRRYPDMAALESQIRTFVYDISGQTTMALPPMDKGPRKKVHLIAMAFNLKSKSSGSGNKRYTTLIKTTRSGIGNDEKMIQRLAGLSGKNGVDIRTKPQRTGVVPRHKEGDEVGKAAPKIGASNIGFQMLSAMGWNDGDRIGTTGGLAAPLTAIIKNTKLGLGATH